MSDLKLSNCEIKDYILLKHVSRDSGKLRTYFIKRSTLDGNSYEFEDGFNERYAMLLSDIVTEGHLVFKCRYDINTLLLLGLNIY